MTESAKSTNDVPLEASIPDGAVPLESILCTEELQQVEQLQSLFESETEDHHIVLATERRRQYGRTRIMSQRMNYNDAHLKEVTE